MYNLFMVRYKHCQEMQTFLLVSFMPEYYYEPTMCSTDKPIPINLCVQHYRPTPGLIM